MNKLPLIIFACITLGTQAQICDSLVPTYYIDFTGANAGTTWASPWVARNGFCCTAISPERCIDFVFTVDSNTSGVTFHRYVTGVPQGSAFTKVDCGPLVNEGDTTPITTCGVHCLTFCKPGNGVLIYYVTSIVAVNPATCTGYTQCDTMILTNANEVKAEHSSEIVPNPFHTTGVLKISDNRFTAGELYIYDRLGQLVRKETINDQTTLIDRGTLTPGIYFFQLLSDDKQVATGKFVIE